MKASLSRWLILVGFVCSQFASEPVCAGTDETTPPLAPRPPRIDPDYAGIVLPPNMAPLNFVIREPGRRFEVKIHSVRGAAITLRSPDGRVVIPPTPWRRLLQTNAGESLRIDLTVESAAGQRQFSATITNTIALEPIDSHLVYRLIKPLYNLYRNVGIYQRNLETHDESVVLDNRAFNRGCVNCHTFLNHSTDTMSLHIRTRTKQSPLLVVRNRQVATVAKTAGYMSWHPHGRLLAFSANKLSLFFHSVGENRDVFDSNSDLGLYDIQSNTVFGPSALAQPDELETWPAWGHDGRYLYFCSAPKQPIEKFAQVRYDLKRVAYDAERNTWGTIETLVAAKDVGQSMAQPKASPDGRFLLYCRCDYGSFPVYQPSSDLHLLDLTNRQSRRLEINSGQSESWHSWSSNSRWVVFSSKRRDGLFARPHFSYVDATGQFHKPFLLPQVDPTFYDSFIMTYNVPELVREPIRVQEHELARAINAPRHPVKPTSAAAESFQVSDGMVPEYNPAPEFPQPGR